MSKSGFQKIGRNKFRFENDLTEIPDDIFESPYSGYFFVFKKKEPQHLVLESLAEFGKTEVIDVLKSNYLLNPNRYLDKKTALYFKEINVVYAKLTTDQIDSVQKHTNDFKIDTESILKFFQPIRIEKESFRPPDNWGLEMIGVHKSDLTGKGIKISILDSGFDESHPDIDSYNIVNSIHYTENSTADLNGHGTHCLGIIAGGIDKVHKMRYGIAPEAELYIAKILNHKGVGRDLDLLKGIFWSLKKGCNIMSISIQQPFSKESLFRLIFERAFAYARTQNCLPIVAAGNQSKRTTDIQGEKCIKPISSPGNCPSAITVGAIDQNKNICDFSNQAKEEYNQKIDFVAPGEDIYSSWTTRFNSSKLYKEESGTSMAVPFVVGLLALLWSSNPNLTANKVLTELKKIPPIFNNEWESSDYGLGIPRIKQ